VPFSRDPDFVDRPESQLAIQYSHQVRETSPQTWVFWVHGSTKARFEEAYRGIADRLELPGRHDPKVSVLQLVRDWLCDEANGPWTMILDNVDNVNVFYPLLRNKLEDGINKDGAAHLFDALGKEHPETLTSVNNLASVLQNQGKYEEPETMNRRALEGREKALGKEHPDMLMSVYCLAYLYHQQKRYDTASELYQRACERKKVLGEEHPDTLTSMNNLTFTWKSLGRDHDALECKEMRSFSLR
jgi:tetratricopeptide (TPR) repeat protein